jgi:phage terminase large subunit
MQLAIDLPRKHRDTLHTKKRFKVLYGGRDGAKSWSVVRYLIARAIAKTERILCVREIQNSIADSVYQLIVDQLKELGVEDEFDVQKNYIRHKGNGSQFSFHGLNGQTATSIKSFEGTTICWIEEAQTVTKRSLRILTPTIRADDSEIIITFNPDMDTDEVYDRFVTKMPSDAVVTKVNWDDNPWRSRVLDQERADMQANDPDEFAHVYGGNVRAAVVGAIYYREVTALRSSNRLCNVPYDPMLKVHVVVDLGFNDFMSLLLVQRLASEIRVIRYIEDRLRTISSYSEELRELKHNWGKVWLPHDATAKTLAAANNPHGATAEQQFQKLEWTTELVPNIDKEQGIRKVREIFPRVVMDKANASELLNRLGRYRRRVNAEGQASTPMHDDQSHGADGFRYLALVADQMSNDAAPVITDFNSAFRRRA